MSLRRGVILVLTLIGLTVLLAVASLLVLYMAAARGPSIPDGAVLVLRPGGGLPDVRPDDLVGQVLGREQTTLRGLVESLRKAARDPRIEAVILRPSSFDAPFWGKLQELRGAIADFRRSGKPVIAHLEYGGDREYYLASAADRVFLLPTSAIDLTGIASYEVFLRGTLDKLGAYPDFLQIGPYKTAANQLTQRGFTEAHREMSEALNRDLYEQLVLGIAEGRRKTPGEVRTLLDDGPFVSEAAARTGLVDGLAYFDQLDDLVADLAAGPGALPLVEGADYERVSARSAGLRPQSRIAVLHASGVITSGGSTYDAVNGPTVGSDTFVEQVRRLRDDESIEAIVLRVDSPGGSSIASDVIWRELTITRDGNPSRPLVASMADVAASGGYYIAMPAHVIVAEPGTLTGSIGIYGGKVAIGGAMEKIGVTTETIASGRNAAIGSPFEPFSPEQRERLMVYMTSFYDSFVEKAAQSRRTTAERIDAVAQGRVWTGRQAQQRGLVDVLGGLDAAVAIAKERAGIPADEDVELVMYPPRRSLYEAIAAAVGGASWGPGAAVDLAGTASALPLTADDLRRVTGALAPVRLFRRGEPLALMPGWVR